MHTGTHNINRKQIIKMKPISNETPISFLTVGDFMELLNGREKKQDIQIQNNIKRYTYGLLGIRNLFNVSHATAQAYKNTFLKPAVSQNGRKLVVDIDLAMELFNQKQSGRK